MTIEALQTGELVVEGRIADSSNATLRCRIEGTDLRCVYKPVRGERPLWDFPEGTLAAREVAAHELSRLVGWELVPITVLRHDAPYGVGSVQLWIDEDTGASPVRIQALHEPADGYLTVLEGQSEDGGQVRLVHEDSADLQRVALLDAIMNNADRKGGHVLRDRSQRLWAIDHGVCFAVDEKLRTVLWGWATREIGEADLRDLASLDGLLCADSGAVLRELLNAEEFDALLMRLERLRAEGAFPLPVDGWPPLPWPVL